MKERLMNNIGLKLLAFFAASMLWLIVVNIDDPVTTQTYYSIPVVVINEEVLSETNQTYQIVDGTQTVDVTVKAKRKTLNKIESEDIQAIADMKELTLNTQIPIEITITGFEDKYESVEAKPRNLQVVLEDELTKKFPIVPTTTGTVRDGYALGEIKAVPENISLRGPESVIGRISRVEAPVSVSGLSSDATVPTQLVLYDEENNVIDQALLTNNLGTDGVSVSVQILKTKSVPLVFETSEIDTADGYGFAGLVYEPQEILVAGLEADLNLASEIHVPSEVLKLKDIEERTETVVDITPYLPEGIKLVDENAGSIVVTVLVEKDGTKMYEVSLGSIVVNGLSSKLNLKYETVDVLEVQVRGLRDVLNTYEVDENISMDLSQYKEAGAYTVPVQIELPDGCTLEKEVTVNIILEKK